MRQRGRVGRCMTRYPWALVRRRRIADRLAGMWAHCFHQHHSCYQMPLTPGSFYIFVCGLTAAGHQKLNLLRGIDCLGRWTARRPTLMAWSRRQLCKSCPPLARGLRPFCSVKTRMIVTLIVFKISNSKVPEVGLHRVFFLEFEARHRMPIRTRGRLKCFRIVFQATRMDARQYQCEAHHGFYCLNCLRRGLHPEASWQLGIHA